MARGHHGHHHRHARGGNVHKVGADLPVFKEAADKSESFKRGGHRHRRKDGGAVTGAKRGGRLDKHARGGAVHGVLSSAQVTKSAKIGSEND